MKICILTDNIAHNDLGSEWGLSVYIEYKGRHILLDTGSTGLFAENARKLNISIENIDFGVLSHGHYDHSDGIEEFFTINKKAPFYIREEAGCDCFSKKPDGMKYIGIGGNVLETYSHRFVKVSGDTMISEGIWLLEHRTENIEKISERAGLFLKCGQCFLPDPMRHEQSLVFDTDKGLVIFNSCCHAGADNIIKEAAAAFPSKKLYALIGGFHLFKTSDKEILDLAEGIKQTGIKYVITGHCTGDRAFDLLRKNIGENCLQMYSGFSCDLSIIE